MAKTGGIALAFGLAATAGMLAMPASAGLLGNAIGKAIANHGNGPVWFERQDGLKGVNQAVLGQFSVVFLTKRVDYSGGGFGSLDDKAKAIGQLAGPSQDDYIKITDAIYADFQAKLKASGVTLADPAAYYASKYYQKVKDEEQGHKVTIPLRDADNADGVAFWPSSLAHRENIALALRIMDFNTTNVYTAQYDYARTARMPVLNVVYVVDFAAPAKSEGAGLLQSVKATAQLAIAGQTSQVYVMDTGGKPAKVVLNKPIVESGEFAEIKDITSGLTKAYESANMIGGIMKHGLLSGMTKGGGGISRRFEYNVTDAANYNQLVTHAGGLANDLFVQQLQAAR